MTIANSAGGSGLIDSTGLADRILLEAELLTCQRLLREFSSTRDRLAAAGKDPNAAYRELLARRDNGVVKLSTIQRPTAGTARGNTGPPGVSLLNMPIVPANAVAGLSQIVGGLRGFGYSGFVQAAGLAEGVNVAPPGGTGAISTASIGAPTYVYFEGGLNAPDPITDYRIPQYFWLHTWQVLVPFPPPTGPAQLSYSFDVGVEFGIINGGDGQVLAFVSVGEAANLSGPVPITTTVGWPVNADLSQPAPLYNGSYGTIDGSITVRRTFGVGGSSVPAVAIAVGAVVGLPGGHVRDGSELSLTFAEFQSSAAIYGQQRFLGDYSGGRIAFHIEPEIVAQA